MGDKNQNRQCRSYGRCQGSSCHSLIQGKNKHVIQNHIGNSSADHPCHSQTGSSVIAHKGLKERGKYKQRRRVHQHQSIGNGILMEGRCIAKNLQKRFKKKTAEPDTGGCQNHSQQKGGAALGEAD